MWQKEFFCCLICRSFSHWFSLRTCKYEGVSQPLHCTALWISNEENSRFYYHSKWLSFGWMWVRLVEQYFGRSIYRKSWILKMILGCWNTFWILSESPFCDCQKPCGSRGSNFVKFDEDFVICCFSISNNPEQTGKRKAGLYFGWSPNLWFTFKLFRWRGSVFIILFGIISTNVKRTFGFLVCQIIRLDSQFQLILIKYWGLEIPHSFLSSLNF